jgi:octaprenyl-diphosphate synthase
VLRLFAQTLGHLTEGELLQMQKATSGDTTLPDYLRIIYGKTASLFESTALSAAISVGVEEDVVRAMGDFAVQLGIAFQIKDDIFDYSDLEELGKPTMSDLLDGKVTLPLIEALRRAPQNEAEHIKALGELLAAHSETLNTEKALQEIKAFVLRFKGDEYAVQRMLAYKKQATEALSIFRDSPEKNSLLALLDYAINRVQ